MPAVRESAQGAIERSMMPVIAFRAVLPPVFNASVARLVPLECGFSAAKVAVTLVLFVDK